MHACLYSWSYVAKYQGFSDQENRFNDRYLKFLSSLLALSKSGGVLTSQLKVVKETEVPGKNIT